MDSQGTFKALLDRYQEIEEKLVKSDVSVEQMTTLSKERAGMEGVIIEIKKLFQLQNNIDNLDEMLRSGEIDQEMLSEINKEKQEIKQNIKELNKKIKVLLLPKDEEDEKNAILEIRQGAGGDEAGLFAGELLNAYRRFAEKNGWKFEMASLSINSVGGVKEATCMIIGKNVFAKMKFESGTHRIQRIPKTESNGRVHTSTVTVAVLPEMEEVNLNIDEKDIRVETFRSSGPGGQSVNTTDSAVRMVHIPTGITVSQQDEKSQIKNREKARKILFARVYEHEKQKKEKVLTEQRKSQIGRGDRSEKIRTYNFPQDRITDHRINMTVHNAENIVKEGLFHEIINTLIREEEIEKLIEYGLIEE